MKNNSTIEIPLSGVESEHCALIVDKELNKVPGIHSHKVQLNNSKAVINTNGDIGVLPKAVKAIRDLGYGVNTLKKTLPVLNMSCASCAASSQSTLENSPGVVAVAVNYASATAQIEYIPTITNPQKLKSNLQSIGYDLMIDESEEAKDSMEDLHEKKFQSLKKRTIAAGVLAIPLVVIGMFFMDIPYGNYIMWALATPIVFIFGKQFFINSWKLIIHRSVNMDTLVAMSTGIAYVFSVFNIVFPQFWLSRGITPHVYFEAAGVIIAFILLGKLLEEQAKGNTSSALKKLIGLQPKTVTVIHEGGQMEMPISNVQVGDIILVKPGEKIAVDGKLTSGTSFVDESTISGEPIPVEKTIDDKVFAGTINQKGSFRFTADRVGGDTVLAHIIKMVQDAQGSKAPVQKLVDKIAGIFVPVVIGLAVLSMAIWVIFGGSDGLTHGMLALVTVLIIACPCALGLATPTAIMAGIGKGAENGILIKDAESLESAKKINTIILDKTGTITEGKPEVANILWLNNDKEYSPQFASIESQSEHPLAEAVVNYLYEDTSLSVSNFESITGKGAKAEINGKIFFVGNASLLQANKITIADSLKTASDKWLDEAKTVIYFSDDKQALAVVAISDKIKETSKEAVRLLQDEGIEVYMLTGDNATTAKAISKEAGIKNFTAEVLPEDKAAFVKELQQQGKVVAMVGDGINDSSALAQADVSIAMGKGSDIAMDVAKMTIISSDLLKIPQAIKLSRYTVATIKQNLFWAFIYNAIGIPIAAGILFPVNGFLLNPMIAGAAMALSSVSVVSNSLRLKTRKI
ncbi:MAG: heavy metal translocating P-type ATPase [Ginsengibacter sp.]